MPIDLRWQSQGGALLDGSGDLAVTSDPMESTIDIIRSRMKAAIDGWKLYRGIGAGLAQALGRANDEEEELSLRRATVNALTHDFLPVGSFDVKTLALGEKIILNVYIHSSLVASATVTTSSVQVSG